MLDTEIRLLIFLEHIDADLSNIVVVKHSYVTKKKKEGSR
jgi:hypothetical protein